MAVKRKTEARKAGARKAAVRRTVRATARKVPTKRRAVRSTKSATRTVKRTTVRRRRRKPSTYQSALAMITSVLDRGSKTLPRAAKKVLTQAKGELRRLTGR